MITSETSPATVRSQKQRWTGLDLARGLAIIGMILAHLQFVPGPLKIVNGNASILFAVLAGVSITLLTRGRGKKESQVQLVSRGFILVLIGLILPLISTEIIVILVTYGMIYMCIAPFIFNSSTGTLFVLSALSSTILPVVSWLIRVRIDSSGNDNGAVKAGGTLTIESFSSFSNLGNGLLDLFLTGMYPVITWIPFFIIGATLGSYVFGRVKIANDERIRHTQWTILVGLLISVSGYIISQCAWSYRDFKKEQYSRIKDLLTQLDLPADSDTILKVVNTPDMGVTKTDSPQWLFVNIAHSGSIAEILCGSGLAIVIIGVCLMICRVSMINKITYPLQCLGKMSLTEYVLHIIIISASTLYVLNSSNADSFTGWNGWYVLCLVSVCIIFEVVWFHFFTRGPLEAFVSNTCTKVSSSVRTKEQKDSKVF